MNPSAWLLSTSAGRADTRREVSPAGSTSTPSFKNSSRYSSIRSTSGRVTLRKRGSSSCWEGISCCWRMNLSYMIRSWAACWSIRYRAVSDWAMMNTRSTWPRGQIRSTPLAKAPSRASSVRVSSLREASSPNRDASRASPFRQPDSRHRPFPRRRPGRPGAGLQRISLWCLRKWHLGPSTPAAHSCRRTGGIAPSEGAGPGLVPFVAPLEQGLLFRFRGSPGRNSRQRRFYFRNPGWARATDPSPSLFPAMGWVRAWHRPWYTARYTALSSPI